MKSQKLRFLIALLVAGLIGYGIGITKISLDWKNFKPHLELVNKEPPPSLQTLDFAPFWIVMEKIQDNYYDRKAIDSQKMLDGAITGMVSSLDDPFTMYLPPVRNTAFKAQLA